MLLKLVFLLTGGLIGTLSRYALVTALYHAAGPRFPYGTLAVNTAGCFLVGLFAALADMKFYLGPHVRLMLIVGFCGAFTTFSALILETTGLIKDGENFRALMNLLASVFLGFLALKLGFYAGEVVS